MSPPVPRFSSAGVSSKTAVVAPGDPAGPAARAGLNAAIGTAAATCSGPSVLPPAPGAGAAAAAAAPGFPDGSAARAVDIAEGPDVAGGTTVAACTCAAASVLATGVEEFLQESRPLPSQPGLPTPHRRNSVPALGTP